jgi:peptidoglycan/xylan/chitin deacetylase (PgdA/CDA1 family)
VAQFALAYHSISPTWSHALATTPTTFAAQMQALARRGFTGVRFSDLAVARTRARCVAITFDDGFRTVFEHAKPVLDELGWPGTVFVVTSILDKPAPHVWWLHSQAPETERAALGDRELAELAGGGWEIGSHTRTHPLLSQLGSEERQEELVRSRNEIVALAGSCNAISYPWGEVTDDVVDAARAAGYSAGSGLAGRFSRGDPMRIPRFAVAREDDSIRFRLKSSGAVIRMRSTPAWMLLDAVRRPGRPLGVSVDSTGNGLKTA